MKRMKRMKCTARHDALVTCGRRYAVRAAQFKAATCLCCLSIGTDCEYQWVIAYRYRKSIKSHSIILGNVITYMFAADY